MCMPTHSDTCKCIASWGYFAVLIRCVDSAFLSNWRGASENLMDRKDTCRWGFFVSFFSKMPSCVFLSSWLKLWEVCIFASEVSSIFLCWYLIRPDSSQVNSFSPLIDSLVNDSTHLLNVTAELVQKGEELIVRSVVSLNWSLMILS